MKQTIVSCDICGFTKELNPERAISSTVIMTTKNACSIGVICELLEKDGITIEHICQECSFAIIRAGKVKTEELIKKRQDEGAKLEADPNT